MEHVIDARTPNRASIQRCWISWLSFGNIHPNLYVLILSPELKNFFCKNVRGRLEACIEAFESGCTENFVECHTRKFKKFPKKPVVTQFIFTEKTLVICPLLKRRKVDHSTHSVVVRKVHESW